MNEEMRTQWLDLVEKIDEVMATPLSWDDDVPEEYDPLAVVGRLVRAAAVSSPDRCAAVADRVRAAVPEDLRMGVTHKPTEVFVDSAAAVPLADGWVLLGRGGSGRFFPIAGPLSDDAVVEELRRALVGASG